MVTCENAITRQACPSVDVHRCLCISCWWCGVRALFCGCLKPSPTCVHCGLTIHDGFVPVRVERSPTTDDIHGEVFECAIRVMRVVSRRRSR